MKSPSQWLAERAEKTAREHKILNDNYLLCVRRSADSLSGVSYTNAGGECLSCAGVREILREHFKRTTEGL